MRHVYKSQAARDAQENGYGNKSYWDYLDKHALELHAKFLAQGDTAKAQSMLTRRLWQGLAGNDGE
jgi:hypothetical protein